MFSVVLATYVPIHDLPERGLLPTRTIALNFRPIELPNVQTPLHLAGAWVMTADDPRLGGLSALAIDGSRFLAVSDLGAVVRFDPPSAASPSVFLSDLTQGPGPAGRKTSRDAESLTRDPRGRGWWIGYEQRHSLWLYDADFHRARSAIPLDRPDWWRNRGVEGLIAEGDRLLALAENGREAIVVGKSGAQTLRLAAGSDIADAARAPDGTAWLLLRSRGRGGIVQAIMPLFRKGAMFSFGAVLPLPKAPFDNYEGMTITPRPGGGWRFWLVTDDGHRIMARTLLVALDMPVKANARRITQGASKPNRSGR